MVLLGPAADDDHGGGDDAADDDDKDDESNDDGGGGDDGEGGCAADGCYAVDNHCGFALAHADSEEENDDYDDDSESLLRPRLCALFGYRLAQVLKPALDTPENRTRSFKSPNPPSLRTSPASSRL